MTDKKKFQLFGSILLIAIGSATIKVVLGLDVDPLELIIAIPLSFLFGAVTASAIAFYIVTIAIFTSLPLTAYYYRKANRKKDKAK